MNDNPFSVFTPEGLDAEKVVSIFSTEMPGLGNIDNPGHAFVMGTRGSGKSILFRYLEPDCQRIVNKLPLEDLPYYAFYISFRETQTQVSELARFNDKHGEVFFNEHLLVLAIGAQVVIRLVRNNSLATAPLADGVLEMYDDLLRLLGGSKSDENIALCDALSEISKKLQLSYRLAIQYVKKHSFQSDVLAYDGELFGFDDLLLPLVEFLSAALGKGRQVPAYLLLDDADSLTLTQTRILNSWVARRLSSRCSLKVAAQVTAYKTMVTVYNSRIEAPHDYQEIDLSDLTTKASEKAYRSRIAAIVQRRLQTVGLTKSADKYFPEDHAQKVAIEKEKKKLTALWEAGEGRGHRARDDAYRYARPNYIAALGGNRKSRSKYSYSGFDQLVHLSSGVTRFFLEAAADMYSQAYAQAPAGNKRVDVIEPSIQNEVIREHASRQMIVALKDLERDVEHLEGDPLRAVQLSNLIKGLGSMFEVALVDRSASERKFFSFALTEEPTKEIEEVLRIGVRNGYLFQGVIGRKEGAGRAPLYVLSRRFAPLFNLDPMGFSAYKFMRNETILELMNHPEEARLALRRGRGREDEAQLPLDFFDDDND